MQKVKKKLVVKKISFKEEQKQKDLEFLRLTPSQRLQLHEVICKRIWGDKYKPVSLKGLKVRKRKPE